MQKGKILTNSKYLADMMSYDCLNLGKAFFFSIVEYYLNRKGKKKQLNLVSCLQT